MSELLYQPRTPLSDHFFYYEMVKSQNASRNEIDNNVYSQETFNNGKRLAVRVLEPLRAEFGAFTPNSWFRCEELEKFTTYGSYKRWCLRHGHEVNDASWQLYFSRKSHPKGNAADIEFNGIISNDDLFTWIKRNLEFDQLIREFPRAGDPNSGWVHVSFSENNRHQAFTIG